MSVPAIVGRSSSHFTRSVQIFARELGIEYVFEPVLDLLSHDVQHFAGNPALKLPVLKLEDGCWFGALNACRALARRTDRRLEIVWPEQLAGRNAANAQELVLQGMATEVNVIMAGLANAALEAHQTKARVSLVGSVAFLDEHLGAVLAELPSQRDLSFLETTLFCFITHLRFREVMNLDRYQHLLRFCAHFGSRESARATDYKFD